MSVNIIDLAKSYFTNSEIDKLADIVGENSSGVKSAVNGILPALLGGVMENASTTGGAQQLMGLLNSETNLSLLDDFSSLLTDKAKTQAVFSTGAKLLPMLLGNKVGVVTDSVAAANGLKKSSVSSLLSVAAPVLLSVIGKEFTSGGMGLSGLVSMLMRQRGSVMSALPVGLAGLLNFSELGDFKGSGIETHVEEKEPARGTPNWLPWLIGALVALGILWGLKNCKKEGTGVADSTTALVDSTINEAADLTDSLSAKVETGLEKLGAFFKKKLPNGFELTIPELGIENNLITFIEDNSKPVDKTTWFNFDRINFETGSAKLSSESLEQIKNLAEILKAYPSINLKVGGYTDNTGDPNANLKLSQDRAKAVKLAIENEGVGENRLEAEGYGQEFPADTNDTEEGRAHNRRIAVRVTKK